MDIKRIIQHLIAPQWAVTRMFPAAAMKAIENAIRESERSHDGELRFAVEGGLKLWLLLHERTPRARAIEGIQEITALLARHFPPTGANPDELSNAPVML